MPASPRVSEPVKVMAGSGKTVLITGASGFIGRHCLPAALDAGFEVHAISSRGRPADAHPAVSWHRADLLDPVSAREVVAQLKPSHLLHLAWIATPGVFWTSEKNLGWLAASVALYRSFFEQGGERVLGVGTCAEYAWTTEDLKENMSPLKPDTPYGRCKLAASLALEAAAETFGKSAAWARLFFPYGPGEPPERLIPSVICGLLKRETVECTHGNQVRDFIFVDDVAEALMRILASPATGTFNVGSGHALSLRDVVSVIAGRLGGAELVKFGVRPTPPGDPERVVADVTRLAGLGWRPSYSIEAGIDRAIAAWRAAAL